MTYDTMDKAVEPLAHLGPCHEWNDAMRMIAAAIIQGCLLEPEKPRECGRVQLRLLAARYGDLEKTVQGEEAEAWRGAFGGLLLDALPMIAHGSVRAYDKALAFDVRHAVTGKKKGRRKTQGKRYGTHVRDILTTGLIVHVIYDSTIGSRGGWMGPDGAKTEIERRMRRELFNAQFVMSSKELKDAWRKYHRFAHLAAALLLFIGQKKWTRFRSAERGCWRQEIGQFLAHAQFFQNFFDVIGDSDQRAAKKQAHIRAQFDLVRLPAELQIQPWSPPDGERLTDSLLRRGSVKRSHTAKD